MKQVQKGFTLIEFLTVVVLGGVIIGGAVKSYTVFKNISEAGVIVSNTKQIADAIDFVTGNNLKPQLGKTLVSSSRIFPSGVSYNTSTGEGTDPDGNIYTFTSIDPITHTVLFPRLIHSLSAYVVNVTIIDKDTCDYFIKDAFNHFTLIGTSHGVVVKARDGSPNLEFACGGNREDRSTTVYLINP